MPGLSQSLDYPSECQLQHPNTIVDDGTMGQGRRIETSRGENQSTIEIMVRKKSGAPGEMDMGSGWQRYREAFWVVMANCLVRAKNMQPDPFLYLPNPCCPSLSMVPPSEYRDHPVLRLALLVAFLEEKKIGNELGIGSWASQKKHRKGSGPWWPKGWSYKPI